MVGDGLREQAGLSPRDQFMLWALGSALFAHVVTFFSVSYFDQSFVFLYVTLAAIGSARASLAESVDACRVLPTVERPDYRRFRVASRGIGLDTLAARQQTSFKH
jgi:hypothetical protein